VTFIKWTHDEEKKLTNGDEDESLASRFISPWHFESYKTLFHTIGSDLTKMTLANVAIDRQNGSIYTNNQFVVSMIDLFYFVLEALSFRHLVENYFLIRFVRIFAENVLLKPESLLKVKKRCGILTLRKSFC
jgi:hypothetical protein